MWTPGRDIIRIPSESTGHPLPNPPTPAQVDSYLQTQQQRSMGSSQSDIRLHVPLVAQDKPFLSTANGVFTERPTSLRIRPTSFSSSMEAFDVQTNQVVLQLKSSALTSRVTLRTPSGHVLVTMKNSAFSSTRKVYDGDQTDQEAFRIVTDTHIFSPTVMYAEFQDRVSGDACRVIVEGNSYDRVVLVYLERGYNKHSAVGKHDDRTNRQFQPIGRIRKADTGVFSAEEFIVEVAPGVDLSLMLLLWRVRYDLERRRRNAARSS